MLYGLRFGVCMVFRGEVIEEPPQYCYWIGKNCSWTGEENGIVYANPVHCF